MLERITIKLAKPLVGHDGPIKQIVLREPTFDEYLQYGDPYVVAGASDGTPFGVENMDVIRKYISVCLVEPKDDALLSQASARVARQVKEKILSFFPPDGASEPNSNAEDATSQTNLSSEAAGSAPAKSGR